MGRITIIGMRPLGVSLGLALKKANIPQTEIVGTGGNAAALSKASKMGAVDKAIGNVRSAVKDANLVVLDATLLDTKEYLESIGPILTDGAVVTDTASTKKRVLEWAEAYLPERATFVGGHPLPKAPLLELEDASESAFEGADYCIIPPTSARQEAVKMVVGMTEAVGARPFFLSAEEHDAFASAMAFLPLVLSSALVTSTATSQSWREMSRLAASEFRQMSHLASSDPYDSQTACMANPEDLAHWLDRLISELQKYRDRIVEKDDDLLETFVRAWEARARWETDSVDQEHRVSLPSAGESMATMMMGDQLLRRYKKIMGEKTKKNRWQYFRRS